MQQRLLLLRILSSLFSLNVESTSGQAQAKDFLALFSQCKLYAVKWRVYPSGAGL
jgi:hypothetical protein